MAPTKLNKPRVRTFSLPIGMSLFSSAIFWGVYYLGNGPEAAFSLLGLGVPFGGYLRIAAQWLWYSIIVVHFYETSLAYNLLSDVDIDAVTLGLYLTATLILGFPILDEIKRIKSEARAAPIKKRTT
ncbi:hypothetical protein DL93DRAFT_2073001 [Clavulina sp. PMI_390]|nr:hypothetical protein DL93DRAFT_2073001 [Clavulina sp. PMI_390]